MNKKLTRLRNIILEEIKGRNDHPTAKLVFETLKNNSHNLSFATVYNTLEYLHHEKLLKKVDIQSESVHYDAILEDHSHLVCNQCEGISDIPSIKIKPELENDFYIENVNISFRGVCKNCQVENHSLSGTYN